MEPGLGLESREQLVGLADDVHDSRKLALAHGLERQRIVHEHLLDLHAETVEDDVAGIVGGAADRVEADLLAGQVLDGLDLGAHVKMELALEHGDHVVDAPLDARDLLDVLEVIQHVGIGDRKVDALQIDEVGDVADRAVADDRQHAKLSRVVERLAEVGGIFGERALEQAAGETDGPVVDAHRLGILILGHRLVGQRQGAARRRRRLGYDQGYRSSLAPRPAGPNGGEHGDEAGLDGPKMRAYGDLPSPGPGATSRRAWDSTITAPMKTYRHFGSGSRAPTASTPLWRWMIGTCVANLSTLSENPRPTFIESKCRHLGKMTTRWAAPTAPLGRHAANSWRNGAAPEGRPMPLRAGRRRHRRRRAAAAAPRPHRRRRAEARRASGRRSRWARAR